MFHIFGIGVVTMHTLASGAKMTTLPGFDPQTFLATLETTKVQTINSSFGRGTVMGASVLSKPISCTKPPNFTMPFYYIKVPA